MSGQDWNTALSVFFVTYALGAVPANIMLQKLGPRIWLPTMMLSVSIILVCASLQKNFAGWTAFRVLLGAVEAGVFPGCSAVLTTWSVLVDFRCRGFELLTIVGTRRMRYIHA